MEGKSQSGGEIDQRECECGAAQGVEEIVVGHALRAAKGGDCAGDEPKQAKDQEPTVFFARLKTEER